MSEGRALTKAVTDVPVEMLSVGQRSMRLM